MTPVLIHRQKSVDRAFERLYKHHVHDVYRYTLAVLHNEADAEDITQATFLSAYRAFRRGERPVKPHNWLIKIAHNECRQRFRASARRPQEVALQETDGHQRAGADDDVPTADEIREALTHLSFNQRAALIMRELEGRSYAEIATVLETSVSAVETLLFRGRRALREQLEGSLTCGQAERALTHRIEGTLTPERARPAPRAPTRVQGVRLARAPAARASLGAQDDPRRRAAPGFAPELHRRRRRCDRRRQCGGRRQRPLRQGRRCRGCGSGRRGSHARGGQRRHADAGRESDRRRAAARTPRLDLRLRVANKSARHDDPASEQIAGSWSRRSSRQERTARIAARSVLPRQSTNRPRRRHPPRRRRTPLPPRHNRTPAPVVPRPTAVVEPPPLQLPTVTLPQLPVLPPPPPVELPKVLPPPPPLPPLPPLPQLPQLPPLPPPPLPPPPLPQVPGVPLPHGP